MSLIKKEIVNDYNLYYYDNNWQKPVITEQRTFQLFYEHKNIPTNYFAFPWAELCDNHLSCDIKQELYDFKITDNVCFTVIQHINFKNILTLIKNIGITHIFVPHKQLTDIELEKKLNIKILAYSLYPPQYDDRAENNECEKIINVYNRKYLASFVGQHEWYYLTKIREKIFDIFSKYADCFIIRRNQWHYGGVVYGDQKTTNTNFEKEYKQNLRETIFSLCPSGSGPNSIRIWESMSYGCIPVILADTLILPEIKNIDYNDFFIIWKENEIEKLYDYLKSIDGETLLKMSLKNIEMYKKYFSTDKMNQVIIEYFNV
jgi:hypothetical protein